MEGETPCRECVVVNPAYLMKVATSGAESGRKLHFSKHRLPGVESRQNLEFPSPWGDHPGMNSAPVIILGM
jgi:hypothetical protein